MVSNLFDLIKYSSIYTLFCIIFFNTNVLYEYLRYFKFLNLIFKFDDYEKYKNIKKDDVLYIEYIGSFYNNFFVRMITCPLCIGFWFNLILGFIIKDLYIIFALYVISIIMYGLFNLIFYGSKS